MTNVNIRMVSIVRSPFRRLSYSSANELIFGKSKHPIRYGFGLEVGNDSVIPEIKYFPKPEQLKNEEITIKTYRKIVKDIFERAANLGVNKLQLELEHPFLLTENVSLGAEVTRVHRELMEKYYDEYGIKSALRVTIADIRNVTEDGLRGEKLNIMLDAFEACAENGADAVCIESYGGKELIVNAVVRGDIQGVIFATGIVASIDVEYLWNKIAEIVKGKAIPTGDTACSHANSTMVLAGGFSKRMISHVFAAVVRAISAVRTLASYEAGGIGPGKDCAYENTIIKAITGYPMSMEGKTAACAHSSLIGNIPMAVADLWSNESIEYTKLYGGMGPSVCLEMLYYDCELMNMALKENKELLLRDLIVKSNIYKDPQALILSPESSVRIARAIVSAGSFYERAINAALEAINIIDENKEKLKLPAIEQKYITRIKNNFLNMPEEKTFIESMIKRYTEITNEFIPHNYEL